MNKTDLPIKRALISVSNKEGIVEFARALAEQNIEIISTGGTSQLLREANIPVTNVDDVTGFPEIMDGRVKTLHPLVHGGILGQRDLHAEIAKKHGIEWIDLVVVNLYPFSKTIQKPDVTFEDAIENIDVGGPTMIRAAAKNMQWVSVVVDPNDYAMISQALTSNQYLNFAMRKQLATKAFAHTAAYDQVIAEYLSPADTDFKDKLSLAYEKFAELRYGENPHQLAAAYRASHSSSGILAAKQYQGKQLSYNNLMDADAALNTVSTFQSPAVAIIKHANPCGVATRDTLADAFVVAFAADSLSAFGGIVALNRVCDKNTAEHMIKIFFEVIIAPDFTEDALAIFETKPNLRILASTIAKPTKKEIEYKFIEGGLLTQEKDDDLLNLDALQVVTKLKPSNDDLKTMLFAWPVLKQIKSNAILIAKNNATIGIGAGQVSRVDAVDIALKKAGKNAQDAVLASDAFFPFRDSIDHLANSGIRAIIQPGGSMRDNEVIAACDEHGIAMVFTGKRCFKH